MGKLSIKWERFHFWCAMCMERNKAGVGSGEETLVTCTKSDLKRDIEVLRKLDVINHVRGHVELIVMTDCKGTWWQET